MQKITFKEVFFLLRPNKHYKIYCKYFIANVSKAHKVIINNLKMTDRNGGQADYWLR
jgi:hypothetical protein